LTTEYDRYDLVVKNNKNFVANGLVVHNTSAHFKWKDGQLTFSSGGAKHETFVECFDVDKLTDKCKELGIDEFTVYGEAYGGKMQGMKNTYGPVLKFVCFDVKIGGSWLSVPQAEKFCLQLGQEFVYYVEISTDIEEIDAERDKPSFQAIRNGCGDDKEREGVVLRPLIEVRKNNGERICAKHKRDSFKETKTPRSLDPAKQKILSEANAVADEWVTINRFNNILSHDPRPLDVERMREYIGKMIEDVRREAGEEVVMSKSVEKAIGKKTAQLVKLILQDRLNEQMHD
jgi:hypothetical protein